MKKVNRTDEQIIGIFQVEEGKETARGPFPRRGEASTKCADLCRKHGMSEGTFYAWKALEV